MILMCPFGKGKYWIIGRDQMRVSGGVMIIQRSSLKDVGSTLSDSQTCRSTPLGLSPIQLIKHTMLHAASHEKTCDTNDALTRTIHDVDMCVEKATKLDKGVFCSIASIIFSYCKHKRY